MKHVFVINPVAGTGKYQVDLERKINEYFKERPEDYEIYITKAIGDSVEFVKKKAEDNVPYTIYACGGDGTLHEVVNEAIKYKHLVVGIIPCGSGNDFVKCFDNTENFFDIDAQVNGEAQNVDITKVNDLYSMSVCNVGFDADAAFLLHKFKWIPFISGSTKYYLAVLNALMKKLGKNLRYELDDDVLEGCYAVSVVANGSYYGGGYKCAPYASINDGMLDICTVDKISRLKVLDLIGGYKKGEHVVGEKTKDICNYRRSKKVVVTSNEKIYMCIDGEQLIADKVTLEVMEGALRVNVPRGSSVIEAKDIPNVEKTT